MKIERLKSILLIILVISSIILTANKWFNEELWPEGYSFFSDVKNRLAGGDDEAKFSPNEEILRPAKIIFNNLSSHVLYTKSSQNYNEISSEITSVLAASLESERINKVDSEEWNNLLKLKSCYFSYPVMYDASYFASQL
jgi:regulatory protein YycH of two-component signal transduction system YycFG